MFQFLFINVLRYIAIPIVAILVLRETPLGYQPSFLAVNIVLTVVAVPMVIWHLIEIIPNLAIIRAERVANLVFEILIQVLALGGFWIYYASEFAA